MNAEEQLTDPTPTLKQRVAERATCEAFEFMYSELCMPLRTVKHFTQLLARRYKERLDEQADEFLDHIVNAGSCMEGLISSMLRYAQVGQYGDIEPVDCGVVLAAVRHLLETAFEESGAVLTTKGLESLQVMAVETEMILLFKHLIGNALKFRGDHRVQIQVEAEKQSDAWLFCVRDNGIPRLFHMRGCSYDIGLATCKKIVEGHGGRIWIEAVPGQGSTFFFTLPDHVTPRTAERKVESISR